MIISLGYRVKSKIATNFRSWTSERLKEYMIKGFTMDDERLKNLGEEETTGKPFSNCHGQRDANRAAFSGTAG